MVDNIVNNASASTLIPKALFHAVLSNDKINICHVNVQSLCARRFSKFDELKSNFFGSKIDVVCMTETWLSDVITNTMISMEGFNLLRNDRNRNGGGICIYFRSNLSCKVIKKSTSNLSNVTEFLLVEVSGAGDPFLLGVYYNPPEVDCSDTLKEHFEELTVKYNRTFFIGDFNTDLLKSSPRSRRLNDTISTMSYTCVNKEPTFFYSSGCSLLDLLITDSPDVVSNVNQVSMPFVSKHDLIFASLNLNKPRQEPIVYRDYKNFSANLLSVAFQRME